MPVNSRTHPINVVTLTVPFALALFWPRAAFVWVPSVAASALPGRPPSAACVSEPPPASRRKNISHTVPFNRRGQKTKQWSGSDGSVINRAL